MNNKRSIFKKKSIIRDITIILTFVTTIVYLYNSQDMLKQSLEYIGIALALFIFVTGGMLIHIKKSKLVRKSFTYIWCRIVTFISVIIIICLLVLICHLFIIKQLSSAGMLFMGLYPYVGIVIVMHYVENYILTKED